LGGFSTYSSDIWRLPRKQSLGVENTVIAQGLLSLSGVGIIVGSIFIGRVSRNYIEMGAVPIGVFGILPEPLISIPFSDSLAIIGGLFFLY